MRNFLNVPLYGTANSAAFSGAFSASASVMLIGMLSILLGIVILGLMICIIYVPRRKTFLE